MVGAQKRESSKANRTHRTLGFKGGLHLIIQHLQGYWDITVKMPPPPHTKPENVLKVGLQNRLEAHQVNIEQRAQELIAVDQSPAALNILHEHVVSKRSRNSPITSLEPVMIQFVELCVDLKKGKLAKDGLYQYKNTAQNTNVGTIEVGPI